MCLTRIHVKFNKGKDVRFTSCNIGTVEAGFSDFLIGFDYTIAKNGVRSLKVVNSTYESCTFAGFNHLNGRTDNPYSDVSYIGIRHEKSPFLTIRNTTIKYCDYGIYAPDAVNVVMDESSIGNCRIGIEMTGTESTGMVQMLCSSLIENNFGISGWDITLAIDGKINSTTIGYTPQNHFDNIQLHFRINYVLKFLEFDLFARNNTWVDPDKYQLIFYSEFYGLIQRPFGGGSCKRNNYLLCDAVEPTLPMLESGVSISDYEGMCLNDATCASGEEILPLYWRGFTCFYNGDLTSALDELRPLADEFMSSNNETRHSLCKQLLAEVHAFVGGEHEYDENNTDTYTLNIVQDCNVENNGVLVSKLRLDVPTFIGSNFTTDWVVSHEGSITGYGNDGIIYTNGIGSYSATVDNGSCSYTRTFNYSYQPNMCDSACQIVPPIMVYDADNCTITWDSIGGDSMTVAFQFLDNDVWTTLPNAVSPCTPMSNGSYRLLINKPGCVSYRTYILNVNCVIEPCTEDPIDITYSATENKFLYFYKTDGSGQLVKSEWISPVTFSMVDSFITWSCENITIKDIFVDENLNVYVIGCDPNLVNKTRIIKYNWTTKQIIWSQWREKFVYYSTVPYGVNSVSSLNVAGYDTYLQRWYIYGYNRTNGSGTTSQQVNYNFSKGTYDGMRYYKENVFTYYSIGTTGTTISFKGTTGTWQQTLPSVVTVREVTILHNEHTVVGADFVGTITLNGVIYESFPYRTILFIEYDKFGNVLNVKTFKANKHYVLKSFTTDGYYKYAYTGYTTENVNIGENVLLDLNLLANHPDACAMVDGGDLSVSALKSNTNDITSDIKFYPNPFTKGINLDVTSSMSDKINIMVYNSLGVIVSNTILSLNNGSNSIYLNEFEQLPSGVYTVKLKSDLMDHTTRVIRIE